MKFRFSKKSRHEKDICTRIKTMFIAGTLIIVSCLSLNPSLRALASDYLNAIHSDFVFPANNTILWTALVPDNTFALFTKYGILNTQNNENNHAVHASDTIDFEKDFPDLVYRSDAPSHYLELVKNVFAILPKEHISPIRTLVIKYDDTSERALGGKSTIIINAMRNGKNVSDEEFVSVLIHEIGHLADLGYLSAQNTYHASNYKDGQEIIWESDASVEFYAFSWESAKERKDNQFTHDFASEYAMTDCFEDFAEVYNLYVTHGVEARLYAKSSEIFAQKYLWMKDRLFHGYEFNTGKQSNVNFPSARVWDSTLIPYEMEQLTFDN